MKRARVRSSSSETKEEEQTQNIDRTRGNFRHQWAPKFGGKEMLSLLKTALERPPSFETPTDRRRCHEEDIMKRARVRSSSSDTKEEQTQNINEKQLLSSVGPEVWRERDITY
ncbi:hypothetical protein CDAR_399151 [Caerostris darwini]|uniref:Uncharacterized protein n=1 Tax=Caerostris darwini TaxID=1538125 RepID=A0AAV4SYF4_9ARAC|nr:hypothetical protein CDAR_399151 [Caerostris darwini]